MYAYMYACIYTYELVYMCTYTYTRTHTDTQIAPHTHMLPRSQSPPDHPPPPPPAPRANLPRALQSPSLDPKQLQSFEMIQTRVT